MSKGIVTKTRAEQIIEQLVAITDRPLTEEESAALYNALHADYQRKWRIAKAEAVEHEAGRFAVAEARLEELDTLDQIQVECRRSIDIDTD